MADPQNSATDRPLTTAKANSDSWGGNQESPDTIQPRSHKINDQKTTGNNGEPHWEHQNLGLGGANFSLNSLGNKTIN